MAKWVLSEFWARATRRKLFSFVSRDEDAEKPLGLWDLTGLGVGGTLGAGIFLLAGRAARAVAGPAVILSFALAAIACIFSGLSYAEMSSRSPSCGGAYSFAYMALGELSAFLIGMCLTLEYGVAGAAVARSWASYLVQGFAVPAWLHSRPFSLLAFSLIIAITALLAIGVREAKWVLNAATLTYGGVVLAIVVVGSFKVDPKNWSPFFPFGFEGVIAGASAVFFSYVGFDEVACMSDEARDAPRNIPFAIILSLGICTALYAMATTVLTGLVRYADISYDAPFAAAFEVVNLPVFAKLVGIATALGMQNTALVSMAALPRIFVAMGRDGLISSTFARKTDGGTPRTSTIICGAVVSILALTIPTQHLADVVSGGTLLAFLATNVSLLLTRARLHSVQSRSLEPFLYIVFLVFGAAATGVLVRLFTGGHIGLYLTIFVSLGSVSIPSLLLAWRVNFRAGRPIEESPPHFLCPLVPLLPIMGCITTALLVSQLGFAALLALSAWLALSILIYISYGIRNSNVDSLPLNSIAEIELASESSDSYGSLPVDGLYDMADDSSLVKRVEEDEF